jgi:hypothetical protein
LRLTQPIGVNDYSQQHFRAVDEDFEVQLRLPIRFDRSRGPLLPAIAYAQKKLGSSRSHSTPSSRHNSDEELNEPSNFALLQGAEVKYSIHWGRLDLHCCISPQFPRIMFSANGVGLGDSGTINPAALNSTGMLFLIE